MSNDDPELFFFRRLPTNLSNCEFLLSSLQALETSFILTATDRHVHALVNSVTAIEGALQAARVGGERDRFTDLIKKARRASGASTLLKEFSEGQIKKLYDARNRIVHQGFSPRDNSCCVYLFATVSLPLLDICYRDFHSITLDEDLRRDHAFADHLKIAKRVCELAAPSSIDLTYCINSFAQLVRRFFQPTFTSYWERQALNTDQDDPFWEMRHKTKEKLESSFKQPWALDCPVCQYPEGAMCDLDFERVVQDNGKINWNIIPQRLLCTYCGYGSVAADEPFILMSLSS